MNIEIRRRPLPDEETRLDEELPSVLARVYRLRGVRNSNDLNGSIDQLLPPQGLKNIESAAALLRDCLHRRRTLVVVGDYDVDGATSTALLMRFFAQLQFHDAHYFVPNRFEYGYGLTPKIIDAVKQLDPYLIVTVDNGISSVEGVSYAHDLNIRVLVTDHHLPGAELPQADVILNPNQSGDTFASKALAGVGVTFYLLLELRRQLLQEDWFAQQKVSMPNLAQYLDLVALGTVADVVPLDRNNRVLVEQGLRRIRAGKCCEGIRALLELGNRNLSSVVASDLGFVVGPRINAAGRLEDISLGIECLLTDEPAHARELASCLDGLNAERKDIEQDMVQQANDYVETVVAEVDGKQLPLGLCAYHADWHQGVTGIVAARLKERYHRPAIVFARGEASELKGSARSIAGVHIRDVLDHVAACTPGLIVKFGGHAMAAGLSILEQNYDRFVSQFNISLEHWTTPETFQAVIMSDGELAEHDFSLELASRLRAGGPWGQGFPEPLFDGEFEVLNYRIVGMKHIKLELKVRGSQTRVGGIVFNYEKSGWQEESKFIRAAFHLDVNEYRGIQTSQLNIRYIEPLMD